MRERYIYQKSDRNPPWAIRYELEFPERYGMRTRAYITLYSEELESLRNEVTFEVSSRTPFGLAQRLMECCERLHVTFTEEDFNQVEWEFSRYF